MKHSSSETSYCGPRSKLPFAKSKNLRTRPHIISRLTVYAPARLPPVRHCSVNTLRSAGVYVSKAAYRNCARYRSILLHSCCPIDARNVPNLHSSV